MLQEFSYKYLPTLIAVAYSIAWSWVDADAKRLEGFRQLSSPHGAKAKDSLQLQYASDFVALVPWKSLKKRHWNVFATSLAMVMIFWGITPIQAGIFAIDRIQMIQSLPAEISTSYVPIAQQRDFLGAYLSASVFNTILFDASMPPFTTRQYAISPFHFHEGSDESKPEEWTAPTELFSLDLTCNEARTTKNITGTYYTNDAGCTIPQTGPRGADVAGEPVDFTDPTTTLKTYTPYYVGQLSKHCPERFSNSFLAIFAKNKASEHAEITSPTAIFCTPTYFSQGVNATVASTDGSVLNVTGSTEAKMLSPDLFDASAFSLAIATNGHGAWADPGSQLFNMDINWQLPSFSGSMEKLFITGYALGTTMRPLEDYLDAKVLSASYEAAYRIFFARHIARVLNTNFEQTTTRDGVLNFQTQVATVVPVFAVLVIVMLVIIALLAGFLLFNLVKEDSHLVSDPASIASVMSVIADDESVLNLFKPFDQSTEAALSKGIETSTFAFRHGKLSLLQTADVPRGQPICETGSLVRPAAFTGWVNLLLAVLFSTSLAALVMLYIESNRQSGLGLPSNNQIVRQIVENYIPTIIATIIEPCWVVLTRDLCMLQPWEDLRGGLAKAKEPVHLNYFSMPIQFSFIKALRAKHLLLCAVCLMALLANLLSIAGSGIMEERIIFHESAINTSRHLSTPFHASTRPIQSGYTNLTTVYSSIYDRYSFGQPSVYYAQSHRTFQTPLPKWSDGSFFYMPFEALINSSVVESYESQTRAFGARLECRELLFPAQGDSFKTASEMRYNLNVTLADGKEVECSRATDPILPGCSQGRSAARWILPFGALAKEDPIATAVCKSLTAFAWFRSDNPEGCHDGSLNISEMSAVACRPFISSALARVTISTSGIVQDTTFTTDLDDDVKEFFPDTHAPLQVPGTWSIKVIPRTSSGRFLADLGGESNKNASNSWTITYDEMIDSWHNDTTSIRPGSLILGTLDIPKAFSDPQTAVPTFEDANTQLSNVHQLLFSTLVATNYKQFLGDTEPVVELGKKIEPVTRIFVSKIMFIIASTIFSLYCMSIIWVFIGRPGRFLPRMPTTLGNVIAYLAASQAVVEFRADHVPADEIHEAKSDLERPRYVYGGFSGTDGRNHVGVEKQPFVVLLHKDLPVSWASWTARARGLRARMTEPRR